MLHVALAASVPTLRQSVPLGVVNENALGVVVTLETVAVVPPVFVSVACKAALVVPRFVLGKTNCSGEIENAGALPRFVHRRFALEIPVVPVIPLL